MNNVVIKSAHLLGDLLGTAAENKVESQAKKQ
jgi:hypothetical protein